MGYVCVKKDTDVMLASGRASGQIAHEMSRLTVNRCFWVLHCGCTAFNGVFFVYGENGQFAQYYL